MEENENNNNNSKKEEKINDLENNIEDKNIFYQNYQNDAENYYENKKLKEIEARKTEIRLFYYSILELFTKKNLKMIKKMKKIKKMIQKIKKIKSHIKQNGYFLFFI